MKHYVLIAALGLGPGVASAQCLLSETFDGNAIPPGWSFAPTLVQEQDPLGDTLSAHTAPWAVDDATHADRNGYLAIPDAPLGNTFAVANDDAPPCNCDMDTVMLIAPVIDLTGIHHAAVRFRVYNDGLPNHGQAWLDASNDGSTWTSIKRIPEVFGEWQDLLVDLHTYDGGPLHLRFRWSDAGAYASGFAIDDVCVFQRPQHDLAIMNAYYGDATRSTFDLMHRSLEYTMLPVEQQDALIASMRIINRGVDTAFNVTAHTNITLNGNPTAHDALLIDTVPPGLDTIIAWSTGWIGGSAGQVQIDYTLSQIAIDSFPADNSATRSFTLTADGIDNHSMAIDDDLGETSISNDTTGFTAGCRFELKDTSVTIHGVGVRLAYADTNAVIHVLIMDAQLNILSASDRHVVTQQDLDLCFAGGMLYVPLDSMVHVTSAMDVIALVRAESDSGRVSIAAGGVVPQGAAYRISASDLTITYPLRAPIVRVYFTDPVTSVGGVPRTDGGLSIYPDPMNEAGSIDCSRVPWKARRVEIIDAEGRIMRTLPSKASPIALDAASLRPGIYLCRVIGEGSTVTARFAVAR